jgi:hypothetical protein
MQRKSPTASPGRQASAEWHGWRGSPLAAFTPFSERCHLPQRLALAPVGPRCLASVPVVLFPLVPNRAHDDCVGDDLEENDVARATERHDQFARATITQLRPTA